MLTLKTVEEAENFVARQKRLGNDVEWDNYDILFYRPAAHAVTSKDGVWRNGTWAFRNRSGVSSDGTWAVDYRNVKKAGSNSNR